MSITVTVDVWCDWPRCVAWRHGCTTRTRQNPSAARRAVREKGWRRRKFFGGDLLYDLCPAHAKCTEAQLAHAELAC